MADFLSVEVDNQMKQGLPTLEKADRVQFIRVTTSARCLMMHMKEKNLRLTLIQTDLLPSE